MRKSTRFLHVFASLFMIFFIGHAIAGYDCPTTRVYDRCVPGRYLSDCGTGPFGTTETSVTTPSVGNSCKLCPENHTCAGDNKCPVLNKIKCPAGQYLPRGQKTCAACPAAAVYCPGSAALGENDGFTPSTTEDKGKINCPTGYTANTNGGKSQNTQCEISVPAGYYIAIGGAKTKCPAGTAKGSHNVNYGSTSSCVNCTGATYSLEGAASCSACTQLGAIYNDATIPTHNRPESCRANVPAGKQLTERGQNFTDCDLGTYADSVRPTNFGSAGMCAYCLGAKYTNATKGATACTDCPDPYIYDTTTIKTSVNQCKVQLPGGKYIKDAGAGLHDCYDPIFKPEGNCDTTDCDKRYYCPANQVFSYGETGGRNECMRFYNRTDENANLTNQTECKINISSGMQLETAETFDMEYCAQGTFRDGEVDVNWGELGPQCEICTENTYAENMGAHKCRPCNTGYTTRGNDITDHDNVTDCKIDCTPGTYVATAGEICTTVPDGTYMPNSTTVPQTRVNGDDDLPTPVACPVGDGLNDDYDLTYEIHSAPPRSAVENCYNQCPEPWEIAGGTMEYATGLLQGMTITNPYADNYANDYNTSGQMYYINNTYGMCTYRSTCESPLYYDFNSPGPDPICQMKQCPSDNYCPDGDPMVHPCPTDPVDNNPGNSNAGSKDASQCYHNHAVVGGDLTNVFEFGTARETCFWNKQDEKYSASCRIDIAEVTCDAGYFYYENSQDYQCHEVGDKYYSPRGSTTRFECPNPTEDITNYVYTNGSDAEMGRGEISTCFQICDRPVAHSEQVVASQTRVYYTNGAYPLCSYDVMCHTGYTVNKNNTDIPSCDPNRYEITLDRNEGTGATPDTTTCTFDNGSCFLPATTPLNRAGYQNMNQWCTAADGTGPCYDAPTTVAPNISATGSAITLYAKWSPRVYKVRLDHQGAEIAGAPEDVYLKYDTAWFIDEYANTRIKQLTTRPERNGYAFDGYYTKPKPTSADGKVIRPTPDNDAIRLINDRGEFEMTVGALEFTTMMGTNQVYAWWTPAVTQCAPGTYYHDMVGCVTCEQNHYCPGGNFDTESGNQGHERCDTLGDGGWNQTETIGNSMPEACYRTCVAYDIEYGTANPHNATENWPTECTFYGISDTGNPCDIENGRCVEKFCNSDYELLNGYCTPCERDNAVEYKPGANCQIASCVAGYHPNTSGRACEDDTMECTIPNAVRAEKVWDPVKKAFSDCVVIECELGYHMLNGTCVVDQESCTVDHGIGTREWDAVAGAWGPCVATMCDAGYTNDPAESENPTAQCGRCRNYYSILGQPAASSYVKGCELASCLYSGELYILQDNECVPICDIDGREDDTGTMKWNPVTKKCDRVCKPGYAMW